MKTNQDINTLLDIYERFGDNAQKALDFVNRNIAEKVAIPAPSVPAITSGNRISDGVYYILQGGRHVSTAIPCAVGISAIGIAHDGHYFSVPFEWGYGDSPLLNGYTSSADKYCQQEIEAILDWDFVKHTNHLKEIGLAINLKEGHYLPTTPVFGAMYKNRKCLNEALLTVGAEEIDFDDYFWLAQRKDANYAWFFYSAHNTLSDHSVYNALQVVAVSPWEPKV